MKKVFFLFAFFGCQLVFSQQADFLKIKKFELGILSDSIRESSALQFFNQQLFTINDSGNSADIFEIDKYSGKILDVIPTQLKNTDWEALTSDSTHLYIGDFGNNLGNRKDLKIYKIALDKNEFSKNFAREISEIPFYFPEQKDFTRRNIQHNFDVEAMIFLNGMIHIFTKEWVSKATTHYLVDPEITTVQAAKKLETFKTGFSVTDATYFNEKLYLVGYTKNTEVFLSIFNETLNGFFFNENPKKYYLGSALTIGQIEGIAADEKGIYLSGEEFRSPLGKAKPRLYFIPHNAIN